MKYKTFDKPIKDFAVASIHIYNMSHVPFNRGLISAQVSNPYEKLKIIKTAIETFLEFDPGVSLDKFIIVNSGTDCNMTKKYYESLDGTKTKFGTIIEVLDAPDNLYPGPYGARMAVYRKYPDYKYYFDCDNDCIPLKDNWLKDGIDILQSDSEIGLVGANISEQPYQCKNNIKWIDVDGKEIPPPLFKYNSGFYTFIPGHVYKLFDKYWGTDWFAQGKDYVTSTGSQGELGFPFRIMQLGYKIADFVEDDTDTFYSYIVPDSIFQSMTGMYGRDDYPTKKKICPFYHAQLKILRPEKWKELQKILRRWKEHKIQKALGLLKKFYVLIPGEIKIDYGRYYQSSKGNWLVVETIDVETAVQIVKSNYIQLKNVELEVNRDDQFYIGTTYNGTS